MQVDSDGFIRMTHDELSEEMGFVASETIRKMDRESRKTFLTPATVVAVDSFAGAATTYVTVHLDEDPPGHTVKIASLLGFTLSINQRVMVFFDRPQAAYVLGSLGHFPGRNVPFTFEGPVDPSTSPRYYVENGGTVISSINSVTSGVVCVDILVNGAVVVSTSATTTPVFEVENGFPFTVTSRDYIQVRAYSCGEGSSGVDLDVQLLINVNTP